MRSAYLLVGALAVAALAACSSSSDSGGNGNPDTGTGGGTPTIKITNPTNNAAIPISSLTDGTDLDIAYTVTNFDLKFPVGSCGTEKNCGHVHLLVNGDACNDVGVPANREDSANPITAGFDYCKSGIVAGSYTLRLELHDDTHAAVKDATGNVIADQITITLTGGATDGGTDSATDAADAGG